ncbi:MAG: radical SAM family heme chaperone HemW [Crocinitomicaceae bacterium]
MISAILKELKDRSDFLGTDTIQTIYFGGGTPSLLTKNEIERFLESIREDFRVISDPEISLEANPDDCTKANLEAWKLAGINRLSIGIQSFKASDLDWMNRAHTADESKKCVQYAREEGFENLTIDLMYGLPDLSESEWRDHVQTAIDWGVPHISSYCLTVEENTLLEKRVHVGELKVGNDEAQSRQFEILVEMLEQNGIQQYEISNFSKPGFESKHNSNYWKGVPYLGIGPSAHSFLGNVRQWNVANNAQYMKGVENDATYSESEILSTSDQFNELLLTGLRTIYGVPLKRLSELCPLSSEFEAKVLEFQSNGWMIEKDQQIYLTRQGRLRADYIAAELFVS